MNKIRSVLLVLLPSLLVLLMGAATAWGERGDDSGRASKNGKVEAVIDGVNVVIEYGRPSVKGRSVWGSLVPYGKVWRTGADEATTIRFDKAVKIEGKELPAGTYSLFTVPGESEWIVVFNKNAKQWGAFGYDASDDSLRVSVEPMTSDPTEALTFAVEGSKVVLRWEKLAVGFEVAAG